MPKGKYERKFPREITKLEGNLPDSIEAIEDILGLDPKTLKKIDTHEILELFKAYNEEERSIYDIEFVITAMFIGQVNTDENIARAAGNLLEEIRSHQR